MPKSSSKRKQKSVSTPRLMLLLAGCVAAANSAPAQPEESLPPTTLPPVVVSGTIIGSVTNAALLPGSATFLGPAEIERHSVSDIHRLLRQVPGVYVREEDGYGLFQNISLRGVDPGRSGKLTLMEDGILTAPAPYSDPAAYYSPNVARMSAVEVLKGSSQVQFGPHITGGAINYVSAPIPDQFATYLKTYYGSHNEIFTLARHGGAVDLASSGRAGYLFEGFFQRSDGYKTIDATPDFTRRDETGFQRVEPMAKLFWEPGTATYHRLEMKYGFSDLEADETYLGLNSADFDRDPYRRYSASRFDNIDTYHHRAYLRHIMEPSEHFRLTTTGYYNKFHRNWAKLNDIRGPNMSLSRALEDPAGLAILKGQAPGTLRVRNNNRDYYLTGVESVARFEFDTGSLDHTLDSGLRYHYDQVDRFQWDDSYTQAANGTITGSTSSPRGAAGDRIEESHALSFFVQDRIRYQRFTFAPGLRFESIWQEFEQDRRRKDAGGTPGSGSGQMDVLGGGLGVSYELTDQWSLFSGVYRGYSVPNPSAAIQGGLREETSLSVEAGARYRSRTGFRAEAVYFHTGFDDLIVGSNIAATGSATTENAGDIAVNGVELLASYDPGAARDWAVRTPLTAAFTYTDARLEGHARSADPESIFSGGADGNRVPYIPEYQLHAQAGLEYKKTGLYLSGTYVPGMYATASNTSQQIDIAGLPDARFGRTDPHFILDLSTKYKFHEHGTLFAGIKNVLDKDYVAARHPHGPRPGLPRVFHAGLELSF